VQHGHGQLLPVRSAQQRPRISPAGVGTNTKRGDPSAREKKRTPPTYNKMDPRPNWQTYSSSCRLPRMVGWGADQLRIILLVVHEARLNHVGGSIKFPSCRKLPKSSRRATDCRHEETSRNAIETKPRILG